MPLGRGTALGDHAASLTYGTEGIMHGFNSIMLKDENGEPVPVYSVASGLDYLSSGPEHAFSCEIGRVLFIGLTYKIKSCLSSKGGHKNCICKAMCNKIYYSD